MSFRKMLLPFVSLAIMSSVALPASAASTDEMVSLCVEEMDKREIADKDTYRAKMKSIRGGALKKLKLEMIPIDNETGAEKMMVECRVRRSEVVDLIVK